MDGILIQNKVELSLEADMSRPRAKRFLGMTVPQWGVLGVIFLCMCGMVAGGYWWLNQQVAAAYESPDLQIPIVTLPPTLTPAPTATATVTPSPTPITYESLIPAGWVNFRANSGQEIWFPASYTLQTEEEISKFLLAFGGLLFGEEEEPTFPLLSLTDTTPSPYRGVATMFQLMTEQVRNQSLDGAIENRLGALSREGRLLESDAFLFKTADYDARRLVYDININGTSTGMAVYAVLVDGRLYFLTFATPFNELYTRLPDFDKSVQTFLNATSP
jgi:hypothetical protein